MKTLLLLASLLIAIPAYAQDCPEGLFQAPNGKCRRERRVEVPKAKKVDVPDLRELRAKRPIQKPPTTQPAALPTPLPVPGGLGGGTLYRNGMLPALRIGQITTTVLVPESLAPSNTNLVWLFLTATNRTQAGMEFVIGYSRTDGAFMGVFDWSCTVDFPCTAERGPITGPDWIWTHAVADTPQYLFPVIDDGKHLHTGLRYVNRTERIGPDEPPRWRNRLLVWNQSAAVYDVLYEHEYAQSQVNCSVAGACGWWGPILETFLDETIPGATMPTIREVGFEDSRLRYDDGLAFLTPDVTSFVPVDPVWQLAHSEPNHSYGAGNVFPEKASCGIGPELMLLILLLRRLRRA